MTEHYPPHWHKHLPEIEVGLEACGGSHTADDLLAALRSGEMTWYASNDAFVIVEILRHPRLTVMNVSLAGGDLDHMRDLETVVDNLARAHGCNVIDIIGRAGWARVFKDRYQRAGVILRKAVHHG